MPGREPATEEVVDWVSAHEALFRVAIERGELDCREGKALLRAMRSCVHVHLGYGSFVEYAGRLFGYAARTTLDKLRTAEALERLPALDRALALGEATWSAVRELARVATAATEVEWLEASKGRTVREIERLVAGHEPGDRPSDPVRALSERHVLRFEVVAETLATFRAAMKVLRQRSGGYLEDDAALLLMARHVLGSANNDGPGDEAIPHTSGAGRASYQLALTLCERCHRSVQEADGEHVEVDETIVEMARCDARHIGNVGKTPTSETDMAVTHVGAPELHPAHPSPAAAQRATQTIPPALRRRVLHRDGGRCVVPGCRHAIFVDVHHVQPRSEGGSHDADNLVVLCGAHHRAVHRGGLTITGKVSTGLGFRHAEGTPYGKSPASQGVATLEKVFGALRGLGFREREARQALELVTAGGAATPTPATAEALLRAALKVLAPPPVTVHHRVSPPV